jgi:hypothetical protein
VYSTRDLGLNKSAYLNQMKISENKLHVTAKRKKY